MHLLMRLDLGGHGDLVCGLTLVDNLLGSAIGLQQIPGPTKLRVGQRPLGDRLVACRHAGSQLRHSLIDVILGQLQIVIGCPNACHHGPALSHGLLNLCLRHTDCRTGSIGGNLVGLGIDLDQKLALVHECVVVNVNLQDGARHPRCNVGHMAGHIGVIGADRVEGQDDSRPEPENSSS